MNLDDGENPTAVCAFDVVNPPGGGEF